MKIADKKNKALRFSHYNFPQKIYKYFKIITKQRVLYTNNNNIYHLL